jgi:photosynthetic reaction center cytochrome c subunit
MEAALKLRPRAAFFGVAGTTMLLFSLVTRIASGQAAPEPKPLMAVDVHKNIQIFRGIPEDEFMATMGFFSAALAANCTYCHVPESSGSWEKYADDTTNKQTARMMFMMMSAINKEYFGGKRVVTCWSCHHGDELPTVTPDLADVYGVPHLTEPDEITENAPGAPSADQVLDKYVEALGGAERLAQITSFVAKGSYQGYNTGPEKRPLEIFAKTPDQRTTVVHTRSGDNTTTFDGRTAWAAAPQMNQPVPVLTLTGGDLEAARVDAQLSFPARVKQAFSEWRVGLPATIDDREVQVLQGTGAGRTPVKLYFDKHSGLLVRQVRYIDSPVGLNPTEIDYADYREVSGVKMPFRWTVTWLDGRSTYEVNVVQTNIPIDAGKFARPIPPAPPHGLATP